MASGRRAIRVLVTAKLMSVRAADAVMAFAPGAQDTMMVLALALHLDPVFVGAHANVALSAGVAAGGVRGAACRAKRQARRTPAGAKRPEVDDERLVSRRAEPIPPRARDA